MRTLPASDRLGRRQFLGTLGAAALLCGPSPSVSSTGPVATRFGVNVYDLFLGGLKPGGSFGTDTLETLGRRGIPFVRFPASGQWAGDWKQFEADPARYWNGFDTIFAAAEHAGVQLVPSIFWQITALAFYCAEPMQAWADPASRTRSLAHRYIQTFVARYDRSPALLMYEFANEVNDWIDVPNILSFWPKADPTMPGRKSTDQDRLSGGQIRSAVQAFGATIRSTSHKPVGAGWNVPRSNAWHLARKTWGVDTPAQFIDQVRAITPPELDVLSMHLYDDKFGHKDATFTNPLDLLQAFARAAAADRRISFLGEFGIARAADPLQERQHFTGMLDAVRKAGINYAALWSYSARPFQPAWDVSFTNDRAYQIAALIEADKGSF